MLGMERPPDRSHGWERILGSTLAAHRCPILTASLPGGQANAVDPRAAKTIIVVFRSAKERLSRRESRRNVAVSCLPHNRAREAADALPGRSLAYASGS